MEAKFTKEQSATMIATLLKDVMRVIVMDARSSAKSPRDNVTVEEIARKLVSTHRSASRSTRIANFRVALSTIKRWQERDFPVRASMRSCLGSCGLYIGFMTKRSFPAGKDLFLSAKYRLPRDCVIGLERRAKCAHVRTESRKWVLCKKPRVPDCGTHGFMKKRGN